jgi:hypothetical protein
MDGFNDQVLNDLITKLLTAAQGGAKLNVNDADTIGQFVCAIIGLGAGLVPYIGSSLGALCNLLGIVLFPPNSIEYIWDALRERIEKLINAKIGAYHLEILKQKIKGFQNNLQYYSQCLQDFDNAETPDEKKDAADTLKNTHGSFLSVILAGIPEFQLDDYAVASLPLFSLVATMHLTLLADGIKRGQDWGYSGGNIQTMRNQFKARTSPSSGSAPDDHKRLEDILLPGSILKEAINRGAEAGVSTEVLDTWKDAYACLYERDGAPEDGVDDLDYVTYAKTICTRGRRQVNIEQGNNYQGYQEAENYQACSDYDTSMVLNVLNYAELWPFMAGDKVTATAIRNVDREIFYGPYGRWADNAAWDLSSPPPVTDRDDNITSIIVRAYQDVDGLQVKHDMSWDSFQGNSSGGVPKQIDLDAREYVTSVSATYGFKLGKLAFTTSDNNTMENGWAIHATDTTVVAPPGYELTSVTITRWVGDSPTGCEGIILGFRPLLTDTTRDHRIWRPDSPV